MLKYCPHTVAIQQWKWVHSILIYNENGQHNFGNHKTGDPIYKAGKDVQGVVVVLNKIDLSQAEYSP